MSLANLILQIFTFNLLTFGTWSTMIPLLQPALVDKAKALIIGQLLYAYAIARVTPGQANVYVASIGYFLDGWIGAILAVLAIQFPGYVMLPFMKFYERIRSAAWIGNFTRRLTLASVGIIFFATLTIGLRTLIVPITWAVFVVTLVMIVLLKWNQLLGLFHASLLGILLKVFLS